MLTSDGKILLRRTQTFIQGVTRSWDLIPTVFIFIASECFLDDAKGYDLLTSHGELLQRKTSVMNLLHLGSHKWVCCFSFTVKTLVRLMTQRGMVCLRPREIYFEEKHLLIMPRKYLI